MKLTKSDHNHELWWKIYWRKGEKNTTQPFLIEQNIRYDSEQWKGCTNVCSEICCQHDCWSSRLYAIIFTCVYVYFASCIAYIRRISIHSNMHTIFIKCYSAICFNSANTYLRAYIHGLGMCAMCILAGRISLYRARSLLFISFILKG